MAAAAPVVPPLAFFFFFAWVIPGRFCMHLFAPS
jgi:hypothetical protein